MKIQLWTDLTEQCSASAYNLPLMKISSYHKSKGDSVEWCTPLVPCDILYKSKIFSKEMTADLQSHRASEVICGGTGYDKQNKLPFDIEHIYPDYSLYPHLKNTAVGFLSRGCPNGCEFCCIKEKEGLVSRKVADFTEFGHKQKHAVLYDPNILACKDRENLLQQIINANLTSVKFQQGLDARFINDDSLSLIKRLPINEWYFAWDLEKFNDGIIRGLTAWKKEYPQIEQRAIKVYVLTNFNTTNEYDEFRCDWLDKNGFSPYVMIYEKWRATEQQLKLQGYYNNPYIFYSPSRTPYKEFKFSDRDKYSKKQERQQWQLSEKSKLAPCATKS